MSYPFDSSLRVRLELLHVGLKAAGKHVSPDLASLLSQLGQGADGARRPSSPSGVWRAFSRNLVAGTAQKLY